MSTAAQVSVADDRIDPAIWKIVGVVLLGPLMTNLDSTIVNVSLSALSGELHTSLTTIQWVTSSYLLALAVMLPLSGWLVDRIGAKRVYLICFTGFTITSLLCGSASSAGSLITFRVLQGMTGGLLAPMAQMMVARVAGRHVARVMGFMVMPILIAPILGPTLAGIILQHASWRWIFLINLPLGILSTILAFWLLPNDTAETAPRSFDITGFLLLPPGLVLLLHSLEKLSSSSVAGYQGRIEMLFALALLSAFIVHGIRRGSAALVDLHLFRKPVFLAAASTQFFTNAVAFAGQLLLPLYLLTTPNISPAVAGFLLAPTGLGMLCSYPMMGTLTERFGSRRVSSTGALIALLGTLPFSLWATHLLPWWVVCVALFVRGVGMGSINIPSIAAAYASVPREKLPTATTTINIVQRLGGPIATTVVAIFLHARTESLLRAGVPQANLHAFAAAFWLLCVIHTLALVSARCLPLETRA
jgi:EmrB/QacA subfamily drug resistance transporter